MPASPPPPGPSIERQRTPRDREGLLSLLLAVALACLLALSAGAPDAGSRRDTARARQVAAKSGILIDRVTGRVLWSKRSDLRLPMASTTKIMTLLVVLEHRRDVLDDRVRGLGRRRRQHRRRAAAGGHDHLPPGDHRHDRPQRHGLRPGAGRRRRRQRGPLRRAHEPAREGLAPHPDAVHQRLGSSRRPEARDQCARSRDAGPARHARRGLPRVRHHQGGGRHLGRRQLPLHLQELDPSLSLGRGHQAGVHAHSPSTASRPPASLDCGRSSARRSTSRRGRATCATTPTCCCTARRSTGAATSF